MTLQERFDTVADRWAEENGVDVCLMHNSLSLSEAGIDSLDIIELKTIIERTFCVFIEALPTTGVSYDELYELLVNEIIEEKDYVQDYQG